MPFQATGSFSDHKGSDCFNSRILTRLAPQMFDVLKSKYGLGNAVAYLHPADIMHTESAPKYF